MAAPNRTTVGRIARQVATDIDGTIQNLPVVVDALDHPDRTIRLTAMWALVVVADFRPNTRDSIVTQAKSRAAVEAQFVVDILTNQSELSPEEAETVDDGPGLPSSIQPPESGGDDGDQSSSGLSGPDPSSNETASDGVGTAGESAHGGITNAEPGAALDPGTPTGRSAGPDQEGPLRIHPDAQKVVQTVVEEMWKAPQRTPSLLSLLEHDSHHVRLTAMWGVALMAEHHPTNVNHLAARIRQHESKESDFLVEMLDHYHDVQVSAAGQVEVTLAPPEEQLDGTLWGPFITYPKVEDRVVGEQSNTFTPESDVLQAVSSIELVGLSRHERVYVAAGTLDNEYTKFNIHTYVPDGRYAIKEYQRNFQPAIDGWIAVDELENVASVHDYGRTPHPWVATDYLPRPLWQSGRLPPGTAVRTGIELCDAVGTMHRGGTAHGAISPWSIGLVRTASAYVPKLTRVGMAAHLGDERALRHDERFAPPEALSQEYGSVGRLADVYGLGVTLYAMLTGEAPPYPRNLDGEFVPVDVPDPTTTVSSLPSKVDTIVQTATATEKPWRYESVSRLGQDLRSVVSEADEQ